MLIFSAHSLSSMWCNLFFSAGASSSAAHSCMEGIKWWDCSVICLVNSFNKNLLIISGRVQNLMCFSWIFAWKLWMLRQEKQFTYNITLWCVHVSTVAVGSNKYYIFWVCACSLNYPVCKAHTLYYTVTGSQFCLYNIFPHYLINGKIFGEKFWNIKCLFRFSIQLLSETFPFQE